MLFCDHWISQRAIHCDIITLPIVSQRSRKAVCLVTIAIFQKILHFFKASLGRHTLTSQFYATARAGVVLDFPRSSTVPKNNLVVLDFPHSCRLTATVHLLHVNDHDMKLLSLTKIPQHAYQKSIAKMSIAKNTTKTANDSKLLNNLLQ